MQSSKKLPEENTIGEQNSNGYHTCHSPCKDDFLDAESNPNAALLEEVCLDTLIECENTHLLSNDEAGNNVLRTASRSSNQGENLQISQPFPDNLFPCNTNQELESYDNVLSSSLSLRQENSQFNQNGYSSSGRPSPAHRVSAMSDPFPETCHASPRVSAVSDPLSEVCGGSECSETGYADSLRSCDGALVRRWTSGCAVSAVSSSVLDDSGIAPERESIEHQVTWLRLRLDQATKTLQAERE